MSEGTRRPGDRIIRRRMRPTRIIELPRAERPAQPRSTLFHARLFVGIFMSITLIGAALLMLPWVTRSGESTAPQDALFTATSAIAVTGLVTRDTATHWNWFGQFIILLLIQVGGLGFMVGASIVLRILGRSEGSLSNQLMIQDNIPTLSLSDAVELAGKIVVFTFAVEFVGAVVLSIRFMADMSVGDAIWHGVFHSVSAFCNAGFDLEGNFLSFAEYRGSVLVNAALIVLIQVGGLSYIVLADAARERRWSRLALNTKLVLLFNAILVVFGALLFLAGEWSASLSDSPVAVRPMEALFQSVAARTAGFATVDFGSTTVFTNFAWVGLMFVGGASGSTAGGVKLATMAIILIGVYSTIQGRAEPQIFRRRISLVIVMRALAVVTLFMLIHFFLTLCLAATEHFLGDRPQFVAVLFETMSAQATVGLSTGITPSLSTAGKLVLVVGMFIGRLGPLTIAYALQQREVRRRYRYPEEPVHIG